MDPQVRKGKRHSRWALALLPLVLVLAGCSSGGGGSGGTAATSAGDSLQRADTTVQSAMKGYLSVVSGCAKKSSPVVCLEAADHRLGNAIHSYANLLAAGHGLAVPKADRSTTLNEAQLLANSLEILGDAQPTQANYSQVLNTFNVNAAITQLQNDVTALAGSLGQ